LIEGNESAPLVAPRLIEDRKLGLPGGVVRHTTLEPSDVQLKDQVVESGSEIEKRIPDGKRPSRIKWFNLGDAKAIFQPIPISFL
jgi:hypothetical protein